jgi:hypothetical protein
MPIRINLLAESQALEDLRRRDPVKRAIWIAVALVAGLLGYSGWLWGKGLAGQRELAHEESIVNTHSNDFRVVLENERKLKTVEVKLNALDQLATNRFLNATVLDVLQRTVIEDVNLLRLRTEHVYLLTPGTKTRTNDTGRVIVGKPATVTEKIVLTLEARDTSSPRPGDQATVFRDTLAEAPYFKQALGRTNQLRLLNLSAEKVDTDGRTNVEFTLECRFPDKTR